ncbi:MAG: glucosaminidase domain-containing protein [Candidatus Gracilibacteria bacterium]|nr:glucosaminidase domain-containing protein [Candidatus Gracilibacteria bacterium]
MNRSILVALLLLIFVDCLHANVNKSNKLAFFNVTNDYVLEAKKEIAQNDDISQRAKEVALNFPQDLLLAVAALESAYGTSKKARKDNNFVGMTKSKDSKISYRKFKDPKECFVETLENLAKNEAYYLIQKKIINGEDDSKALVNELVGTYVVGDDEYAKKITDIIRQNKLSRFNDAV